MLLQLLYATRALITLAGGTARRQLLHVFSARGGGTLLRAAGTSTADDHRHSNSNSNSGRPPHTLQQIHDALSEPREERLTAATALMNQLTLQDLGLTERDVSTRPGGLWRTRRTSLFMPIASSPAFDLAVFLICKGGSLPLHDHPNMEVTTKLVHGRLRLQSYDWKDAQASDVDGSNAGRAAVLVGDEVVTAPAAAAWGLAPDSGNLHALTALENSVMVDILMPPYDIKRGRMCTYYAPVDSSSSGGQATAASASGKKAAKGAKRGADGGGALKDQVGQEVMLKRIPEPPNLVTYTPYTGLKVQDRRRRAWGWRFW